MTEQLSNFKLHFSMEVVEFDDLFEVLVKSLIETIDAHVSTLPLLMTCGCSHPTRVEPGKTNLPLRPFVLHLRTCFHSRDEKIHILDRFSALSLKSVTKGDISNNSSCFWYYNSQAAKPECFGHFWGQSPPIFKMTNQRVGRYNLTLVGLFGGTKIFEGYPTKMNECPLKRDHFKRK